VRGEEFRERYASRAVEATIPFPRLGEASWVIEFEKLVEVREARQTIGVQRRQDLY